MWICICMYVVRQVGPAQYWGERKRENRDTHIHVTSGQSFPSPKNTPPQPGGKGRYAAPQPREKGGYAAPQPRGKGVHFHSVFSNTHNIIAEQGCGQDSYTPLATGDFTAVSLAANTQTALPDKFSNCSCKEIILFIDLPKKFM